MIGIDVDRVPVGEYQKTLDRYASETLMAAGD